MKILMLISGVYCLALYTIATYSTIKNAANSKDRVLMATIWLPALLYVVASLLS